MSFVELYTHNQLIDGALVGQAIFSFCFLVSALPISSNQYAGFVGVLTGLTFAAVTAFTYYGLRVSPSRTYFGMILGCCVVLTFISLQSAVFWGQYDDCQPYPDFRRLEISSTDSSTSSSDLSHRLLSSSHGKIGVQCFGHHAMTSLCVFSVFMFLSYLVIIVLLFRFKNDILGTTPLNEGYSPVSTNPLYSSRNLNQSLPLNDDSAPSVDL